ncbi:hypothetical protein [Streptomyces sp. H27-C3]|uniref:hypothetical protein n=1 Tax=Streptomyces sp. H27-C3 TaxID=3046305 RepID=UPI0024B9B2E1|nr:hypothetical protein [Streptomyces sp. H27-C3]MDJ0463079.1 hypothetical protein [Streptomyces sp. H27-C3]
MGTTDPEKVRLEHRLGHYETAVKRLAANCQDAESLRILGELEAGLKNANEDADVSLDRTPRKLGSTWVLLVQEMDAETRTITKAWRPVDGRTRIDEFSTSEEPALASDLKLRVRTELEKLGRRSQLRGYAGLTSSADGLVDDLSEGHVLTLDDGTSLQLVQADLVAAVQE